MRHSLLAIAVASILPFPAIAQTEIPKVADPRLVVELVAAAPDIVHPVACDFDHTGRLLVIESHTHFAPKDYKGPKHDRVLAFDVNKAGKPSVFFEGTRHTMDLAVHPDGSVYLATRNEILRLTADGKDKTRIVFLDTKGDYPHNGLSGLCFDSKGDLYFGMGENAGKDLKLIGSDGVTYTDEQGGHIFHCTADGKKLRRVATGFWNPFGICRDIYGRVFAVDNDPDQSPPCRMLHIVEGGDYGFRYNYGRSGKHPFQSWHGELPGTLPMMTGVGEAPCEILSYESDGLPAEYRGQLLVTTWADHRVERYKVVPHGASFKAERLPFVQGGNNFRPVGLCTAPDGSLYVTDWVLPNYNLHGKGAIWHIRWKDAPKVERSDDPKKAIFSMHRPLREAAARKLASDEVTRDYLREQLSQSDARVRATVIQALFDFDCKLKFIGSAQKDTDIGIRELAVRTIPHDLVGYYAESKFPAPLRAQGLLNSPTIAPIIEAMQSKDPFLRHSAIKGASQSRDLAKIIFNRPEIKNAQFAESAFLAMCRAPAFQKADGPKWVGPQLRFSNESVRFLVVKYIADEKLADQRAAVEKLMADPKLSVRMYMACATALARIDGKEVNEKSLADYFAKRLAEDETPAAQRVMLLRQVPATHPKLTVDLLAKLLKSDDVALMMEAVRALAEHPSPKRHDPLLEVLRNPKLSVPMRGFAILGLNDRRLELRDELLALAKTDKRLQSDVERALSARVPPLDRPPAKDLDAWLKRLDGKADAEVGARVFFHPRVGCAKCHRIDGRGTDVGPDLSNVGNTDRRHILESILQPSANVAPHYVAWHLEFANGKVKSGMLIDTNLDEYTYLDAKGDRFRVKTGDLVEQRSTATSIMPEGLIDTMTDQELRDLLTYLQARK
jgi:putative membrane-bound dehydrogenase-like protein